MGVILSFGGFLLTMGIIGALSGRAGTQAAIVGVLIDVLVIAGAYAAIVWWAPHSRYPNLVRTSVLTTAIIALGGITFCSSFLWQLH